MLCADMQTGDSVSATEKTFKIDADFAHGLVALFAGTTSDVWELLRLCKERIGSNPASWQEVKEGLWAGMEELKQRLSRTRKKSPGTDALLLVCGHLEMGIDILYLDREGAYSIDEFAAIGCGSQVADSILRWRVANTRVVLSHNLDDIIYYVYEAKRLAEISPDVGKLVDMRIGCVTSTGFFATSSLSPRHLDFLMDEFAKYGPQCLPEKREYFRDFPDVTGERSSRK